MTDMCTSNNRDREGGREGEREKKRDKRERERDIYGYGHTQFSAGRQDPSSQLRFGESLRLRLMCRNGEATLYSLLLASEFVPIYDMCIHVHMHVTT